ncbi:hypothetical protein [Candidatus Mycobacterium methanotrophicum]|uniref:Uncharacterized protein n=1 Tax=Candidatus Mycobacterium methanotrophicum TaxID=2943498 RepID=A0ABY4QKG5_9MYCO|nr:hypothetical protein [Candidatus Mycobacterium methanotrophicum]UQX10165.1 hypothetical protein M5I08_18540 [Candidatus Mycobacterium methanotrophicum]
MPGQEGRFARYRLRDLTKLRHPIDYTHDDIVVENGGQSLRPLTLWLSDSGVAPAVAKSWQTSAVRQILWSGPIAGCGSIVVR